MPGGSDAGYMREYREGNPEYAEKNRNRASARRKAQKILADGHDVEYARILSRQGETGRARTVLASKYPVEFERLFSAQLSAMRNRGMVV